MGSSLFDKFGSLTTTDNFDIKEKERKDNEWVEKLRKEEETKFVIFNQRRLHICMMKNGKNVLTTSWKELKNIYEEEGKVDEFIGVFIGEMNKQENYFGIVLNEKSEEEKLLEYFNQPM